MPDDTPAKLGMSWAVAMDKPWFVGKRALERMAELPIGRRQVGLEFVGGPMATSELRGEPLVVGGRMVGRVTSAERSPVLDRAIGLGWVRVDGDATPERLTTGSGVSARVVPRPFYDPEGGRMRA
jgi:sarcosine oxidase subunit alpha